MKKSVFACGLMVVGALMGGCAGKAKMDEGQTASPAPAPERQVAGQDTSGAAELRVTESSAPAASSEEGKLTAVYFDYDSYVLSEESRKDLARNAQWLKNHPEAKLTIEGHADERGSDEYNMALGEKRAQMAREYLEGLGISAERLITISYGEEKPAVQGSDESAWSKNRRAEFL